LKVILEMNTYAFLILAVATLASSQSDEDMEVCWRDAYGRGVGTIPNYCQKGFELQGALCYPLCKENYTGVGPVCWENCPEGYTDIGAFCVIPASVYWNCPWYDVCGVTFAKGCRGNCSEGYHDVACSCRRDGKTITKKSYGRGAGDIPGCNPKEEECAGLCYEQCKTEYFGVGPVCWRNDSGNATYGVQCNPFAYGHNETDCEALNSLLKEAGITSTVCIGSIAMSIITGHVVGPKVCRDLITKVIPKLAKTRVC